MRVGILGPLTVSADDGAPVAVNGPRPRALLVLLALRAGQVVPVETLIAGQYGDEPPAGAAAALQAHVSRLRKSVADVSFDGVGYRLAVEPDDVDALRFERLAGEGRRLVEAGAYPQAVAVLTEALALWRGNPLVELPFGDALRERLSEVRLSAIEDLVDADPGHLPVADLRALVAAHPLRERLRGRLMRAFQAAGRPGEALAEFEDTRRLLADELGTDPSPELSATHLAILRADQPRRAGLPAQLTSFVGRHDELARLSGTTDRLVTVLGPGGTGKTRLAIEAARDRNACFVDLSPVTENDLVPHAVLGALGLRESADGDPVRQLVAALDEPLVLVLDNCEQVVAGAAVLARTLLAECPSLSMIATSREPLGLTGETLLPLAPLGDDAVRLFVDRAVAVRPGFTVEDRAVLDDICARLDGLPLAIELAAARLRQFTVDELAERLATHGPFRLLSRGDRTAAERHRTLTAVVAWSWDLLTPRERTVAARFAVFTGGATLSAAETVCDTTDDVLADLIDRSLIETDGRRLRMLDTIRLYCAGQLTEDIQPAHARHYLALAQRADPYLRRTEQLDRLAELTADHDNLMAALHWAVDADPHTGARLVASLTAYWWLSGRRGQAGEAAAALLATGVPEGEEYVACVIHSVPRAAPGHWDRARAVMRGLTALRYPFVAASWGMTVGPWGTPEEAGPLLSGDPWNVALGQLSVGLLSVLGGRPAEGEAELHDVLATFRSLGERWGMAQALDWLAEVASWRGEWDRAHTLWAEALDLYELLGALDECVDVLCRRGGALLRQGDGEAADDDFRRAAGLSARAGHPSAVALLGLAGVTDSPELLVRALDATGDHSLGRSRVLTALGRHTEAIALTRTSPLTNDLAAAVEGFASTLPGERAAFLLGTAVALRGTAIAGDRVVATTAKRATEELGAAGFATAYARGAAQSRADADATVSRLSVG